MSQKILIDGSSETQTQFALLSDNGLEDFEFESVAKKNLKGNIYLGKVSRIEASLQAAFVEIGSEKNGFLAFGDFFLTGIFIYQVQRLVAKNLLY